MNASHLACLTTAMAFAMAGTAALADMSELEAAQAGWERAFGARDGAAAAEAVFTEDARLLPPGEPMVEGRAAIGDYWQAGFDAGVHGLELGAIAVEMHGDTMIETGTWSVRIPNASGGEDTARGKALVVWKRGEDGVWRMSQDMWNRDE